MGPVHRNRLGHPSKPARAHRPDNRRPRAQTARAPRPPRPDCRWPQSRAAHCFTTLPTYAILHLALSVVASRSQAHFFLFTLYTALCISLLTASAPRHAPRATCCHYCAVNHCRAPRLKTASDRESPTSSPPCGAPTGAAGTMPRRASTALRVIRCFPDASPWMACSRPSPAPRSPP
jgi:hypothetical protein